MLGHSSHQATTNDRKAVRVIAPDPYRQRMTYYHRRHSLNATVARLPPYLVSYKKCLGFVLEQ